MDFQPTKRKGPLMKKTHDDLRNHAGRLHGSVGWSIAKSK